MVDHLLAGQQNDTCAVVTRRKKGSLSFGILLITCPGKDFMFHAVFKTCTKWDVAIQNDKGAHSCASREAAELTNQHIFNCPSFAITWAWQLLVSSRPKIPSADWTVVGIRDIEVSPGLMKTCGAEKP